MFPIIDSVPHVSRSEMEEVDRLMVDKYKISLIQMMENAGRNLAVLANHIFLKKTNNDKKILILAGPGGNGGGAITAGRWLHSRGAQVKILISVPKHMMKGVPEIQIEIAENLGIEISTYSVNQPPCYQTSLIIDGIIGYGIKGEPRGIAKEMIDYANESSCRIISLDIPSGMDPDLGTIHKTFISAETTMTLALPKKAFINKNMRKATGKLFLANISVPPQLYKNDMKIENTEHIFKESDIVEIK